MGWQKHCRNPILALRPGCFDSQHIHAPAVVRDGNRYRMWYSGSDRTENEFHRIGYAESADGIVWARRAEPILTPAPAGYYTTPAILREADGSLRKEDGQFKMWFTSHNLTCDLYLATSGNGLDWHLDERSPLALKAYAPTVLYEDGLYKMWFTMTEPTGMMAIGAATSRNGIDWEPSPANPVLRSTESWEHTHALYPFVLKRGRMFEMYYTTYGKICELAVATSRDGIHWQKNGGPILSPGPASAYDSLYCSRACVVIEPDGCDKLYYASRVDMVHKYFAIALATRLPSR